MTTSSPEEHAPRKHVAFFVEPFSATVTPSLSVVAALVRRGYRVTYATSEHFAPAVCELGAEAVIYPTPPGTPIQGPMPRSMTWDEIAQAYFYLIDLATYMLPDMRGRYEGDRPDIVVYSITCFAGRIFAERWKIPAIQTSPMFAFHDTFFSRKKGVCYTPEGFVEFNSKLDAFLREQGIDAKQGLFHKEDLNIHFLPRAFQFDSEAFDQRFFFAGRCIAERPSRGDWKRTFDDDSPVILVSASTARSYEPEYFDMLIEALEDLPWRVVMATGSSVDLLAIRRTPERFEVHQYLPYPKVLPSCWLNICHGGTSTIVESMHHGVAMICLSLTDEQAENSDRVAELGLGVHIRGHLVTAELLRRTVLDLADDRATLDRVKEMQRVIQQEPGGADDVADQIERYCSGKAGVSRASLSQLAP